MVGAGTNENGNDDSDSRLVVAVTAALVTMILPIVASMMTCHHRSC